MPLIYFSTFASLSLNFSTFSSLFLNFSTSASFFLNFSTFASLSQEFFNQSDLEKLEGLPVSPFMDRDKVTKPTSQCSFIGFVLLPLFEALGEILPQLDVSNGTPPHYNRFLREFHKTLCIETASKLQYNCRKHFEVVRLNTLLRKTFGSNIDYIIKNTVSLNVKINIGRMGETALLSSGLYASFFGGCMMV